MIHGYFEFILIPLTNNTDFVPNTKNIMIILFTVKNTNKYLLMIDIVNHIKITLVKMLLTNYYMI